MANALDFVGWNHAIAAGMAVAVWLCSRTRFLRRRPSVRHGLWLLVLLKLVTPPMISVPVSAPTVAAEPIAISKTATVPSLVSSSAWGISQDDPTKPVAQPADSVSVGCCVTAPSAGSVSTTTNASPAIVEVAADSGPSVWQRIAVACLIASIAVTGLIWAVVLRQLVRMRRLLHGHASTSERLTKLLSEVAQRFQLGSAIGLQIVDAPVAPMLIAWPGRATILMPRELTKTLDDDSLRSIVAHECAHLVRRDHWTNLFALFVASMFWWNPLVWFVRRRLLAASEACCDALALERLQGSRKTYAATLLMVVDSLKTASPRCPAFGMTFGSSQSLTRRFELIADDGVRARTTGGGWMLLALALAISMFVPAQAEESTAPPAKANSAGADDAASELQTFCCPAPASIATNSPAVQKTTSPAAEPGETPKKARTAETSERNPDGMNLKLERLSRAYKTFSGVGYFVESPSWSKRLHLTKSQADALLALDELVWDTRALASPTSTESNADRNAREHLVLRHAEQMVKLGYFTPTQSDFVTRRQLSDPQFKWNALRHDPFFQQQLGVTLSEEQWKGLDGKGFDSAAKEMLSEQQQLLLIELSIPRAPPKEPPQLAVPTKDDLAQVKLSNTFTKLRETEKALRLSKDQVRALRDLEHLTRLGLYWIDRRGPSDDVTKTRDRFLKHAEQIALLGILPPGQRAAFRFMC